jgi:hypothetical protein
MGSCDFFDGIQNRKSQPSQLNAIPYRPSRLHSAGVHNNIAVGRLLFRDISRLNLGESDKIATI